MLFPDPEGAERGIAFYQEDTDYELPDAEAVRRWLYTCAEAEGGEVYRLEYTFCSDAYLHRLNVEHLQHDTLTDIITFPMSEVPDPIEGELFVSVERVRDNATDLGIPYEQELRRVIVHGLLHLLGYGDKTQAETATMRAKEEEWLEKY